LNDSLRDSRSVKPADLRGNESIAEPEIDLVSIEQIKVGMRVPALNPEVSAQERAEFQDPDPATWRLRELPHTKPSGGVLLISMLRPIVWIHERDVDVGGSFAIDMPELGARGQAKVLALTPCPEIQGVQRFKVSRDSRCPEIQGVQRFKVSRDSRCPEIQAWPEIQGVQRFKRGLEIGFPSQNVSLFDFLGFQNA